MFKLHPIVKDIKNVVWCGPGALATISGRPVSEVMHVVRKVTGQASPKGVRYSHLERSARLLGYALEEIPIHWGKLSTMARWTADNRSTLQSNAVVLCLSNHYVTVSGRTFNDNASVVPIPLKKAPYRRSRVRRAWRVVKIPGNVPAIVVPPPAPGPSALGRVEEYVEDLTSLSGYEDVGNYEI